MILPDSLRQFYIFNYITAYTLAPPAYNEHEIVNCLYFIFAILDQQAADQAKEKK